MACEDCSDATAHLEGPVAYYRWKNANLAVLGCNAHLREAFDAMSAAQRALPTPPDLREAAFRDKALGDCIAWFEADGRSITAHEIREYCATLAALRPQEQKTNE